MTNRPYTSGASDLRPAITIECEGSYDKFGVMPQPSGPYFERVHALFQRLNQSLGVLSGACELVSASRAAAPSSQALRIWLRPHARQVELAMHSLRDMRLTRSPAATDLSQSLTVLVLAADMLAQGQLSDGDTLVFYDLLRRNSETAARSLGQLRAQLGIDQYPDN